MATGDSNKGYSGVAAFFKDPNDVLAAAEKVKARNYKAWDVFTPFPVHGMDDAMGIKKSFLPWVTFIAGIAGLVSALALEIGTSAWDWPINIGGKPYNSLPAFIPVAFELTVLFGGLATVGAMFAVNKLWPNPDKVVLDPSITRDRFVIYIPSTEKGYDAREIQDFLRGLKADEVRLVNS